MAGIGIGRLGDDDPQALGDYRLLWRLTSGGMGRIYLARSAAGGPLVAVKTLLAEGVVGATDRQRFAREVRLAQRIDSAYTARVLAADPDAPRPWMAIEYIPAPALSDLVRDAGPLPAWAAPSIAAGAVQALLALHAKGVIHRDVKPQNILLPLTGPLLIDFGISHAVDLTRTSLTLGTIPFTSPEQARGEPSSEASDVYALGATLFHLAVGHPPYPEGLGAMALLALVQAGRTDLTGLPRELDPLVRPCLAVAPEHRPRPAQLVGRALETLDRTAALRSGRRWLPVEWTAMIEAYEAHGRALGAAAPPPASEGPTRPLPPPAPTLLAPGERAARRERERKAREARRRREAELRRAAAPRPPGPQGSASRQPGPQQRTPQPSAPQRPGPPQGPAPRSRASQQPGPQRPVPQRPGPQGPVPGWPSARPSAPPSRPRSSGRGGGWVAAVLLVVALLVWQPWESDHSSGSTSGSSLGSSGGSSSGSPRGASDGSYTRGDKSPSARDTPQTDPAPDPTQAAFKAVSPGDCLPVYDTGYGGDSIRWNTDVPPAAVSCFSGNANVRVTRVTSGSCPTGTGEAYWGYRSPSSGETTRLCLTRIYRPFYCMLGRQTGDRISLAPMSLVDCRSTSLPARYNRILHITGVYQAPPGAGSHNCLRTPGDSTPYWAWLVHNGATLVCTTPYQGG
ncbi:serine/threonine-protein kinase [Streptomyces sp. PR69]|uniref:serine/threonine-protein kinase n=1 Tax=Streptomyces sp. PR69 TaxID=2984950 RepID=UPI002263D574|nr:serine/threonine-protein kinase [Streptomyces sp. PR69]